MTRFHSVDAANVGQILSRAEELNAPYVRAVGSAEDLRTWVVFSHVRIPTGRFAQSRVFGLVDGAKLFFNTSEHDWYAKGVPGVGNSYSELVDWLARALAGKPADQVTFVGHSMGAHAALAVSAAFPEAGCVATSPELSVGERASRSHDNGVTLAHPWGNLYHFLPMGRSVENRLTIFGAYDPVDAHYLAQERTYDGRFGTVYRAPYHHGVTEYLTSNRYYLSILDNRTVYSNALADQGNIWHAPDPAERTRYWTFAELHREFESGHAARAGELAAYHADWENPGWLSLVARVHRHAENLDAALVSARKAALLARDIAEYPLQYARYARLADASQDITQAEALLKAFKNPHRSIQHYFEQVRTRPRLLKKALR